MHRVTSIFSGYSPTSVSVCTLYVRISPARAFRGRSMQPSARRCARQHQHTAQQKQQLHASAVAKRHPPGLQSDQAGPQQASATDGVACCSIEARDILAQKRLRKLESAAALGDQEAREAGGARVEVGVVREGRRAALVRRDVAHPGGRLRFGHEETSVKLDNLREHTENYVQKKAWSHKRKVVLDVHSHCPRVHRPWPRGVAAPS